jgi:hypothetical protein
VNPGELQAFKVRVFPGAIAGAEIVLIGVVVPFTISVCPPDTVRVEVLDVI